MNMEDLPKVDEIDAAILTLERTIETLKVQVAELRAKRRPYYGRAVPYVDPREGKERRA